MAVIRPDPISLTTHHIRMWFRPGDKVLSSGTGFIFKFEKEYFLITAWHNVSGKNPLTNEYLHEALAIPDTLRTLFRNKENPIKLDEEEIEIYLDENMNEPIWYVHPIHEHLVDVVAVPIPEGIYNKYKLFPINEYEFDEEFYLEVSDESFVIGYPFIENTKHQMPIWKKASIASEPDIDIDNLPKLLVDTATRPGLSGSPVIMQRTGVHGYEGGKPINPDTIIGRIRNFIGVYSGRTDSDTSKAQLGIVWKAAVINEILMKKQQGKAPELV